MSHLVRKSTTRLKCFRADSPFRTGPINTLADLKRDYFSLGVHWYNTRRLMHRLGRRPKAEVEAEYYSKQTNDQIVVHT